MDFPRFFIDYFSGYAYIYTLRFCIFFAVIRIFIAILNIFIYFSKFIPTIFHNYWMITLLTMNTMRAIMHSSIHPPTRGEEFSRKRSNEL